ncbi:hypothetical protein VE03_01089 [Pseudogymnoascus sp. 23342-1-I1]|nr:hypothetical protein VE03_01089 [Pseudogymnoascus sp. 23342-1-I1]
MPTLLMGVGINVSTAEDISLSKWRSWQTRLMLENQFMRKMDVKIRLISKQKEAAMATETAAKHENAVARSNVLQKEVEVLVAKMAETWISVGKEIAQETEILNQIKLLVRDNEKGQTTKGG